MNVLLRNMPSSRCVGGCMANECHRIPSIYGSPPWRLKGVAGDVGHRGTFGRPCHGSRWCHGTVALGELCPPPERLMVRIRLVFLAVFLVPLHAASSQEPYKTPPPIVERILDAPRLPLLMTSSDGARLVLAERTAMPSIADLAQPMLRLAGLRINPLTTSRFSVFGYRALTVRDIASGAERTVTVPEHAKIGSISWAPDNAHIAFVQEGDEGLALWIADAATGTAQSVLADLNGVFGSPCVWLPDSARLLCRVVPPRGPVPEASPVSGSNRISPDSSSKEPSTVCIVAFILNATSVAAGSRVSRHSSARAKGAAIAATTKTMMRTRG